MTEQIPSDKHRSNPEIKMAVMEERLRHAAKRDETIIYQLDTLLGKVSKVETSLLLGEQRFKSIEEVQGDTSTALKGITGRVDAIEKKQDGNANKVVGGVAVVGFFASIAGWAKELFK